MAADDRRLGEIEALASQLMRFVGLMKRRAASFGREGSGGIEYAAYGLLAHLVVDGPKRTTALADAVHADPSTISRQTASLVRHGLLERRPDPVDGRASILAATQEGERVFEANRARVNQTMATILQEWSKPDVNRLAGLLSRLNTDLEAHHSASEARGDHHLTGSEGRER
jgi:DNA-binding MarR family transcriptional regulator